MLNFLVGSGTPPTSMSTVVDAMTEVLTFGTKIFEFIIANPVLCFCLAAGLIPLAVTVLGAIKGVAKA